ncbi:polar amino acid transport system substrate-binding protein [Oxalobacteraceae bacterium GrIS 1.11]
MFHPFKDGWWRLSGGLLLLIPLCCAAGPAAYRLLASELPPFATGTEKKSPGSLVEIAQELSRRVGSPPALEFYPWQRALMMTANLPHIAVLPLTRTPEREAQYRWLVKLYWQNFVFIGRHGHVDVNDIAGLMKMKIAVLRGSPHLKVLAEAKFADVSECSSVADCMRLVKKGVVDATYGGEVIHRSVAKLAGDKEGDFDYSAAFRSGEIWLAGSMDFSDAEILVWQAAMKSMHDDGSYDRILRKYGLAPGKRVEAPGGREKHR